MVQLLSYKNVCTFFSTFCKQLVPFILDMQLIQRVSDEGKVTKKKKKTFKELWNLNLDSAFLLTNK